MDFIPALSIPYVGLPPSHLSQLEELKLRKKRSGKIIKNARSWHARGSLMTKSNAPAGMLPLWIVRHSSGFVI
jgi:hypothetical protein